MNKEENLQEIMNLLDELKNLSTEELDEIEMLCGCTGKKCESGWLTLY